MNDRSLRIDALRGVAILLVLQLHLFVIHLPLNEMGAPWWMIAIMSYFWAGVEIFFVMSSYLLTSNLLKHQGQDNLTGAFYLRRALRILPLYWILLLAGVSMRAWWVWSGGDGQFWLWMNQPSMFVYIFFVQNWVTGWVGEPFAHFYSPTWSLAVEEHFYLGLPLLIARLSPRRLCLMAIALVAISPLIRACLMNSAGPAAAYYWSFAHLDAFSWGALLALAQRYRPDLLKQISARFSGFMAAALLLCASFWAPEMLNYKDSTLGVTLAALAGAFALLAALQPPATPENSPGSWTQRLAWCGRRCYSLYLLHFPTFGVTYLVAKSALPSAFLYGGLPIPIIALLATFLLAAFAYRFIELPFMALADRIAPYARTPRKVDAAA